MTRTAEIERVGRGRDGLPYRPYRQREGEGKERVVRVGKQQCTENPRDEQDCCL